MREHDVRSTWEGNATDRERGGSIPVDAGRAPTPGTPTVQPGYGVYALDSVGLGEVSDTTGDYFTVKQGLLRPDLYIPFEDVRDIRPDTVYVNATKDEVELKNWQEQPLHREHPSAGPTRP